MLISSGQRLSSVRLACVARNAGLRLKQLDGSVQSCSNATVVGFLPLLGPREISRFMKAQLESEPGTVLQRALLRELSLRFDPIVVIGPEEQLLGVTDVDRLMSSMLGSPFSKSRRHLR